MDFVPREQMQPKCGRGDAAGAQWSALALQVFRSRPPPTVTLLTGAKFIRLTGSRGSVTRRVRSSTALAPHPGAVLLTRRRTQTVVH